ncbi:MAG: hypothetical protein F6K11_01370 [Leptolyngbya sp. SIO3F4]|nr:hypothetical protein [Leptolyngbya sp. SIO3F4]
MELIKDRIRATLPSADTARSLPHKKTPCGRTNVLHMNYMRSQTTISGAAEIEHLIFFAEIAAELGLGLEILTDENCQEEIEQELKKENYKSLDYAIAISRNPISKWAEDSVEYLENGQIAVLTRFHDDLLDWAMTEGRRHRWQGKVTSDDLEEVLREDQLWILLGTRVNAFGMALERELAALTQGQTVGHIRAYIEGGNMIAGEDAEGQPVLLLGKDAIAATAHLYQLDDNEVKKVICEDFGLERVEQVIAVEQPGKFHLDMGILFLGEGVVIVNDSSKSLSDATEMAELAPCVTTEKMAAKLRLQCSLENDAAQDLQTAGMKVYREKLEDNIFYNFFNGEFVEGKDGFTYYITNGAIKEQEERFETLMVKELNVVRKVFFSPQDAAKSTLQERGGVGCRLKGARLENTP